MKRLSNMGVLFGLAVILAVSCWSSLAAQMSLSGQQDISRLMTIAKENFDLSKQDAVILFEGKKIYWLDDGRQVDFIHRIIWINTEYAAEEYGDHRIPYDSEHCNFHVATVRTWRDNQWWETGETGIVETTPYELEKAYDYTNIREMMLLHNGIELPCILEVAYFLEDKEPFRNSIDGIWTFAKDDPVVWSWFGYGLDQGNKPQFQSNVELSSAEPEFDKKYSVDLYWWKKELLNPVTEQHTDNPALEAPYIAYSTWPGWQKLGAFAAKNIDDAARLDSTMTSTIDSLIEDTYTGYEKTDKIVNFVNTKTGLADYDNHFWSYFPRPAMRTFNTAYGHFLDRTVLTLALLRAAGFTVNAVYVNKAYGKNIADIPVTRTMNLGLIVDGPDFHGYYDPIEGTVTPGWSALKNRSIWIPGIDDKPEIKYAYSGRSTIDLKLNLSYSEKDKKFTGSGILTAAGDLCPYDRIIGTGDRAKKHLENLISGVLADAKITGYNPLKLDENEIAFSIDYEIAKLEADGDGRLTIETGEPAGGILDLLPEDMQLFHQSRESAIYLPGVLSQSVELKLKLDGLESIHVPEDKSLNNDCGEFILTAGSDNGMVKIEKRLNLDRAHYSPDYWPVLRRLLLAETHRGNNTIIFKIKNGGKENNK